MPGIEIDNLHYRYPNKNQPVDALNGFQLQIQNGEFLCIIGPSGCGKSTLLRMLSGLDTPDSGEIRIDDSPVKGPGADRMIVFQDYALLPWLTAEGNVRFALRYGKGLAKAQAAEVATQFLERVGMEQAADRYPFQLSGGMRQRVAIARALAMDTDILLLDEPFGALDAKTRTELQQLLLKLWQSEQRKTVVFVTHDIEEAILLADRIVFMENGQNRAEIRMDAPRPRKGMGEEKDYLLHLFEGVGV